MTTETRFEDKVAAKENTKSSKSPKTQYLKKAAYHYLSLMEPLFSFNEKTIPCPGHVNRDTTTHQTHRAAILSLNVMKIFSMSFPEDS